MLSTWIGGAKTSIPGGQVPRGSTLQSSTPLDSQSLHEWRRSVPGTAINFPELDDRTAPAPQAKRVIEKARAKKVAMLQQARRKHTLWKLSKQLTLLHTH
mmetsp:Transcript_73861/g.186143  ORF Transcript_73861/g.186143 Transcript_73861/m.186143 type:complete len:100 (+) Transcript_73861:580-879(+)